MEYIMWFLFDIVFIYIIYYIFVIRNTRRDNKHPIEAEFLIKSYKLDINKFSYFKFVRVVGLVSSIDIAIVAMIVTFVKGFIWQILFSIIVVIPVIVVSFMLLGKYYKNKELKDNTTELEKEKKYLSKKKNKKK